MAKFISLRVEPDGGTAFDYHINVGDVVNIDPDNWGVLLTSGGVVDFPLDITSGTNAETSSMTFFIRRLLLEAKQRGGNHYIVPVEESPVTITDFS